MASDTIHITGPEPPATSTVDPGDDERTGHEAGDEPQHTRRTSKRWLIAGAAVAILAAALVVTTGLGPGASEAPVESAVPTSTQPPPALSVAVFETILPSTVTIITGADGGLGAGVIVNADGLILTALHVVSGAGEIEIRFADGASSAAELVGSDPANDVAILLPDELPGVIVPAVLGDPSALKIGDEAYAVGHPVGLVASMSAGVISGLDRSATAIGSNVPVDGLIQFDAAVNPGNSGGPLLNRRGEVVGIVTGLVNPSGDDSFSGIGFATTITAAGGGLAPGQ